MKAWTSAQAYLRLRRSQWLDRDGISALQRRKLGRLLEHAYRYVPFHRERFDAAGLKPRDIRSAADLSHLPITTKRELLDAGPSAITSRGFGADELVSRRTTGSTGEPFTFRVDRRWIAVQQGLFLRALAMAGWGFGRKLVLIGDGQGERVPRWMRWSHVPHDLSAAGMFERIRRLRPDVLYGWVTPLLNVALHALDEGVELPVRRSVITTAEALDGPTRELLGEVFGVEVFELFGLTEMGIVAGECGAHDGLHLAEDVAIVESVEGRLILTNLDLLATPFLRYQTGDVGRPGSRECPCGRRSARLKRIEGRLVDCVRLRDGGSISPYRLTLAIEPIPGIRRYRVVQEDYERFSVELEDDRAERAGVDESVVAAVEGVLGSGVTVRIVRRARLDPPPGHKFRVVESRVRPAGDEPCAS
ncbi:MAG: phenylacetate--CoA ligase family protein [Gemmatimonadota bacterium]